MRARALVGRTIGDIAARLGRAVPSDPRQSKGFVGQLLEYALGADAAAGPRPDFVRLGVELKSIPVGTDGVPLESTFCCSIAMADTDREEWSESRLKRKLACVLFLPYVGGRDTPMAERLIGSPKLWNPTDEDLQQLRQDYELLIGALGAGSARVSARDGEVLQVRPKGRNNRDQRRGPEGTWVQPVAFYLRPRFTGDLLRRPDESAARPS